jgi:hypothetical protein
MKSHDYQVRLGDIARMAGSMAVPMLLFAVLIRLGAVTGLWPSPWPALDLDRTILTHQANASGSRNDAELVLIGDSSCLMDVSAVDLCQHLGGARKAINLGTFMYTGFEGYASLLSRYEQTNPNRARVILLLVHPEMLRGVKPVANYLLLLSDLYAGADPGAPASIHGQLCGFFGLQIFQNRFLGRCPVPLPGEYGRFYGFNLDLCRYMDRAWGSAVDPHRYIPGAGQGDADYRLSPSLEPSCLEFRAAVPDGARLLIGLTPVPGSFAAPNHDTRAKDILLAWGRWLQADCLTNLPSTLPDDLFAGTTHLNQQGCRVYTKELARALQPHLRAR